MRLIKFILLASIWNPLLIIVISLLRGFTIPLDLRIFLQLVPAMFGGWILYFVVKKIYGFGWPATAVVAFIILAPITSYASLFGGLLGPIGIVLTCFVISIPAWLAWAFVRLIGPRSKKHYRNIGRQDGD